jgi:molecular chaperone HtpG
VDKGVLELDKRGDEESQRQAEGELKDLVSRIKQALGEKVKDVRVSKRLTASPACLVADEHDLSMHLERLLQAAGQDVPRSKPILEVNPTHPLIQRLKDEDTGQRFDDWASILFDQALLSEGGQLEDPASFVHRLNDLLLVLGRS